MSEVLHEDQRSAPLLSQKGRILEASEWASSLPGWEAKVSSYSEAWLLISFKVEISSLVLTGICPLKLVSCGVTVHFFGSHQVHPHSEFLLKLLALPLRLYVC